MTFNLVTEDDLRRARQVPEPGAAFRIDIAIADSPDSPPRSIPELSFQGPYAASYSAEWRTGVLDKLLDLKAPSCRTLVMADEDLDDVELTSAVATITGELHQAEAAASDIPVLRSFLVQSFGRDLTVAAWLNATVHVSTLFEPLLRATADSTGLGVQHEPSGATALGIIVPDLGQLSWEAVVDFREHAGSEDARGRLREIEERALDQDPGDLLDFPTTS